MSPQWRMKRSTTAGSFFLSVISVMTEISDQKSSLSRPSPCASHRRHHRELLARPPQVELIFARGLAQNGLDPRRRRTVTTQRDHLGHDLRGPREQRLHAAIGPVAHPSLEAGALGPMLDPGAIADTLHPAADRHLEDGLAHLFPKPQEIGCPA